MPQPISIFELKNRLSKLIEERIWDIPVFVKGPPGIGKSSAIKQVAEEHGLELSSLRISQLDPQGLKGLPKTDEDEGVSRWLPPAELPRGEGPGVLFLDEYVTAPPAIMKIAQRLTYERKTGAEYSLPSQCLVVAAGNRLDDPRAQVNPLPAPTANRMIHCEVESDLPTFRRYAIQNALEPDILGFLEFRPALLFDLESGGEHAFPSPRSWEHASRLLKADLPIAHAVGEAAAAEFQAYMEVEGTIPGLDAILEGHGNDTKELPDEPSAQYSVVAGLAGRAESGLECFNAAAWLVREREASDELVQLLFSMLTSGLEDRPEAREAFIENAMADEELRSFMSRATALGLEL
jgi:hypothetical protein